MRILQVARSSLVGAAYMGPIANDVCQLADATQQLGHSVSILDTASHSDRPRFPRDVELLEVATTPVDTLRSETDYRSFHAALGPVNDAIVKFVAANRLPERFDVMHVHDAELAIALSGCGVPLIFTCHTPNLWIAVDRYRSLRGRLRKLRLATVARFGQHDLRAIRLSSATVGLGEHLKAGIDTLFPGLTGRLYIASIHNGTEPDLRKPGDKKAARQALAAPESQFRIIFIGRLEPAKGVRTLIDAVPGLLSRIPNLQVTVVGPLHDDDYIGELRRRCENLPVAFTGFVANNTEHFANLVNAADVGVVPSLYDNQPNTALQMLSMGLPLAGSRVGAIPDMVTHDVGYVFTPGDAASLADAVTKLHGDPAKRSAMAQRAPEHVVENFSWKLSAEKHLELYARLI